jgi:hypothetical protein
MYSQIRFTQASIRISTKYFQYLVAVDLERLFWLLAFAHFFNTCKRWVIFKIFYAQFSSQAKVEGLCEDMQRSFLLMSTEGSDCLLPPLYPYPCDQRACSYPVGYLTGYPAGNQVGYPASYFSGNPAGYIAGYPADYSVDYLGSYPLPLPRVMCEGWSELIVSNNQQQQQQQQQQKQQQQQQNILNAAMQQHQKLFEGEQTQQRVCLLIIIFKNYENSCQLLFHRNLTKLLPHRSVRSTVMRE